MKGSRHSKLINAAFAILSSGCAERKGALPTVTTLDAQFFVQVFIEFFEEAGGIKHHAAGSGATRYLGVTDIKFIFRPRDRDVKQAAFFFHVATLDGAPAGKLTIGSANQKNDIGVEI